MFHRVSISPESLSQVLEFPDERGEIGQSGLWVRRPPFAMVGIERPLSFAAKSATGKMLPANRGLISNCVVC